MSLLDKLEPKLRRFAIPHLIVGMIVCQVGMYAVMLSNGNERDQLEFLDNLAFVPSKFLEGEVWRLFTVLIIPPFKNIVCAFFGWYLLYLMGQALEMEWGRFRFNVYFFVGYVATIAAAFMTPNSPANSMYLQTSIFLAFAQMFPNFTIYIYYILPVKIKWLALLTWGIYGIAFAVGGMNDRLLITAAVANFLLFFGSEIIGRMGTARRRMEQDAVQRRPKPESLHRCSVCGATEKSHPKMDFRYCSQCQDNSCYCSEHLANHLHVQMAEHPANPT